MRLAMSIEISEIELITSQVWELICEREIARSNDDPISSEVAPIIAHVELTGAYNGTVALQAGLPLVRFAAAKMFDLEEDAIGETELEDTARELANMIGGNIKCLVEQPTLLGLPHLTPLEAFDPGADKPARCVTFQQDGVPLQVRVYG